MAEGEGNFSEKLGAILQNPQAMSQIMAIANSLSGNGSPASNPHLPHSQSTPSATISTPSAGFAPENAPSNPDFAPLGGKSAGLEGENTPFGGGNDGFGGQNGENTAQGGGYAAQGGGYAAQGGEYAAQGGGNSAQGGGYTTQGGGYAAQGGGGMEGLPAVDPRLMTAGMEALRAYQNPNHPQAELLNALKPFLAPERGAKVDKAIRIARLAKAVRMALEGWKEGGGNV